MQDMMHTKCGLCGKHAVSVPFGLDGLPYANYTYCKDCIKKGIKLLKEQEEQKTAGANKIPLKW